MFRLGFGGCVCSRRSRAWVARCGLLLQSIPSAPVQVSLFAEADVIITAHTGGLMNVGFVRPFGVVIEVAGGLYVGVMPSTGVGCELDNFDSSCVSLESFAVFQATTRSLWRTTACGARPACTT